MISLRVSAVVFVALSILVPTAAFADGESASSFQDSQFHSCGQNDCGGGAVLTQSDIGFVNPLPPQTGQTEYVPPASVYGWVPPVEPLQGTDTYATTGQTEPPPAAVYDGAGAAY